MNILIYIPTLDQSWGGVRQYSVGLLKILAKDKMHKYFIYHNNKDLEIIGLLASSNNFHLVGDVDVSLNWVGNKIKRAKEIVNAIFRRLRGQSLFAIPTLVDRLIYKNSIDIVHCPYQFVPDTSEAKLIVTLHDVQEIHFPDFFTAEERAYRATHFLNYLRKADRVVVSYNHVKQDLVKYFAVPSTSIDVVLLDMGQLWFDKFSDKDILALTELSLPNKYLFYPANTWKHKNHIRLLESIALLRDEYKLLVNLVFSGHLTPHFEQQILPIINQFDLQNQVKFLGVVSEANLYNLYKHALGVIVPTLYEAGSFPLMESILLKIPVICSNVTSLPETISNEKFTFDPFSLDAIGQKVKLLWNSVDFRNQSIENSTRIDRNIRNNKALEKFIDVYSKCMFHK